MAAALALPAAASRPGRPPKPKFEAEKCYGVAKAGKNDCQTANSSCAGTSKRDGQGDAWLYMPAGSCERLVNGSPHATGVRRSRSGLRLLMHLARRQAPPALRDRPAIAPRREIIARGRRSAVARDARRELPGRRAALRALEAVRRDYPISLHGVGLSLGSADALDARHLARWPRSSIASSRAWSPSICPGASRAAPI